MTPKPFGVTSLSWLPSPPEFFTVVKGDLEKVVYKIRDNEHPRSRMVMVPKSGVAAGAEIHPTDFLLVCIPEKRGLLLEDWVPDEMNFHKQTNMNSLRAKV